jgi:integrase
MLSLLFRRTPSSDEIWREMRDELRNLGRSRRHIYALENDLRAFLAAFPRLEKADRGGVVNYLSRLSERVGPRRCYNVHSSIVQLSRFARSRDYLPENKRSPAEKIRRVHPGYELPQIWTVPEAKLLLGKISPEWLPVLVLGLFAGLRTSEILRLDWSAIDFERRSIRISRQVARKKRIARAVPMTDNLVAWLAPYRGHVGLIVSGGYVKRNENALSREMLRIRDGLQRKDNALRHSFGSYRLAITKSCEQVALEMGNSARIVRENYNSPQAESEAVDFFNLRPPSLANVVRMQTVNS